MSAEGQAPLRPGPIPRNNGFGALRLLFAALVIITHSVEMVEGSFQREPLYQLFGGMTFGSMAVIGFFLISGYLIAASYASSPSTFFVKRVLRIYPAFLVCYVVCVLIVAPLAGADLSKLSPGDWLRMGYRMLMLKSPEVKGVLDGHQAQTLNGSMWTIAYEFRCYIMAAVFGALGLYARPRLFLALTGGVIAVYLALTLRMFQPPFISAVNALVGEPHQSVRLLAAFMCGTAFWLLQVRFNGKMAAVGAAALLALQFAPPLAELAFMVFGGYVLFWIAFNVAWRPLRTINAKDDISYGLYLYAWPAALVLQLYIGGWTSLSLALSTLVLAALCGALSWRLIEKPAMTSRLRGRSAARGEKLAPANGKA